MNWRGIVGVGIVILTMGSAEAQYTLVDLGPTVVHSIAPDSATIVGMSAGGLAARLSNPQVDLSSSLGTALGVSTTSIVGERSPDGSFHRHAFLWTPEGGPVDLVPGDPVDVDSTATDINASGVIVGYRDQGAPAVSAVAGIFANGGFTALPTVGLSQGSAAMAINASGDITGGNVSVGALLWPSVGAPVVLGPLGSSYSLGQAINDAGLVCGIVKGLVPQDRGILWYAQESYRVLQPLPQYTSSICNSLDNNNTPVGSSYLVAEGFQGQSKATRWDAETGNPEDLNSLVQAGSAWDLTAAVDINQTGIIVGTGFLAGVAHSWALVPTPPAPSPPPVARHKSRHDLNGDGVDDIPWHNRRTGQVGSWMLHNGTFMASQAVAMVEDMGWHLVGIGDLDGDGKAEWVWHHDSGATIIWWMHGSQIAWRTSYAVAPGWELVTVGDVDSDGTADLVWWDTQTGRIHVWFFQAGKLSHNWDIGSFGIRSWRPLALADLEGSGRTGLVWWHEQLRLVAYWPLQNGLPTGGKILLEGIDPGWRLVGVRDVNGDGEPDYLWRNVYTGTLYTWLLKAGVYQSYQRIEQADMAWESH